MGQKVNPIGLRLGINKTWSSRWFVDPKLYAATLHEDLSLRKTILDAEETKGADIAEVEIIRHPQRVTVIIHTGRPGVLIGAKGANIEKLGGNRSFFRGREKPHPGVVLLQAADNAPRSHRQLLVPVWPGDSVARTRRHNGCGWHRPTHATPPRYRATRGSLAGDRHRIPLAERREHALEFQTSIVGMGFGTLRLQKFVSVRYQFRES